MGARPAAEKGYSCAQWAMKSSSAELDTRSDRGWPTKLPRRIAEHRRWHLSNHKNNIRFLKQCRVVCIFIIRKKKKRKKNKHTPLTRYIFFFFLNKIAYRGCTEEQQLGKKKKSIVVLIKSIKKEGVLWKKNLWANRRPPVGLLPSHTRLKKYMQSFLYGHF